MNSSIKLFFSHFYRLLGHCFSLLRFYIFCYPLLASCGSFSYIISPLYISHPFISLGSRTFISWDARIEAVPFYNKEIFKPRLTIGDNVSIEQRLHLTFASSLSIAHSTTILSDVVITDIDHQYSDPNVPAYAQSINVASVNIDHHCLICKGVVILPGTTLGNHCVVAANSVVRGYFPPFSLIAGSPARIVKVLSD